MNSRIQGGKGVGAAIAYFTAQEIPVFVPILEYPDYDLIIDSSILQKVQVRTSEYTNKLGNYAVNMRVFGGNTTGNKLHKSGTEMVYDLLFILLGNGMKYLIPKDDIAHIKSQLVITDKHNKYKV